jgi:hypothetical protein
MFALLSLIYFSMFALAFCLRIEIFIHSPKAYLHDLGYLWLSMALASDVTTFSFTIS